MSEWKPFVHQLGEHLDGYGEVCRCVRVKREEKPLRPEPVVASPAIEKKLIVPTWDAAERQYAQKRGFKVWVHSES